MIVVSNNHPNRNWRRRWAVDETAMEAQHECGLIVRFVPHHAGGWEVHSPNGADVVASLAAAGEARPADRLQRLTDEATRLFERVLARAEHQA
jgi:hypothetical protein